MKNEMFKSSLVFVIGRVLLQATPILTTPIFTRLISLEDYGQFNLYTTIVSFFSIFIGCNTSGSLAIAKVKYGNRYDQYASHALSVSLITAVFFAGLSIIFKDFLASMMGISTVVLFVVLLQALLSYVSGFYGNYLMQKQKIMMNFYMGMIGTIVSVPVTIYLVVHMHNDFHARVIGGMSTLIPFSLFGIGYIYTRGKSFIKKEYLKFTWVVSLPLVLHLLGHQVLSYIDRIMIANYLNVKEVALYSFGYSAGQVLQMVLSSINTVWVPWYLERKKEKSNMIEEYVKTYIGLIIFLTIGYLTISNEVISLLGSGDFLLAKNFVVLVIVSYFIGELYTIPLNIQFFKENTKFVPVGTVISAIVNIVLNMLLIPLIGIYGAAIATLLSYVLLFLFHFIISKKLYKTTEVSMLYFLTAMGVIMMYAGITYVFMDNIFIRWILGLIYLMYYLYTNKEKLALLLKKR